MTPIRKNQRAGSFLRLYGHRRIRLVATCFLILFALTGLAYSPFIFGRLGGDNQMWTRLGNIGQSYGALSALLSGLALIAVTMSIRIQVGQRTNDKEQSDRQRHHDMIRYVFDDPHLSQCWGARVAPEHIDERLFYYVNMILLEWQSVWQTGDMPESQLRRYASMLFDSEVPRLYWQEWSGLRRSFNTGKRAEFVEIVQDEFRRALLSGSPSRPYEPRSAAPPQRKERSSTQGLKVAGIGVATGAAIAFIIRRR